MSQQQSEIVPRILIVDDNRSIHEDIRKLLESRSSEAEENLEDLEAELFGDDEASSKKKNSFNFQLDSAYQGQEGLELVNKSIEENNPYAVAFIDMRMPPGWDGVTTIENIWKSDPNIQVIVCTAYSDHSWEEIDERVGSNAQLLILKKPFDNIEIVQAAHALTRKWMLHRESDANEKALKESNALLRKEMKERQRMELELRLAQKLEAVGQLAAGVAHEINTPIQYIGDSVHFLKEGFEDLISFVQKMKKSLSGLEEDEKTTSLKKDFEDALEEADFEYLEEQIPLSFDQSFDGIERVSKLVRAMKEFAHPGEQEKKPADINRALQNALEVGRGEYKHVANIETDFAELPQVLCFLGDLNQVFLNLIVNASHAIGDAQNEGEKGTIFIRTKHESEDIVLVEIEDTGTGIPEEAQDRIFDPFFTTKAVGKGTGQGLAIAHNIVMDKHGGSLSFETESGKGTKFLIRLPISGQAIVSNQQEAA